MPLWAKVIYILGLFVLVLVLVAQIVNDYMERDKPLDDEFQKEQNRLNYELEIELRKQKHSQDAPTKERGSE